jgi:lipid-binding SYLF domain-containing protein
MTWHEGVFMKSFVLAAAALLAVSRSADAALDPIEAARLTAAARVVQSVGSTIPADYWRRARCVVVVPDLKKTAFIVGGEYGKGVMSCRSGNHWGAPVFTQLGKGSWGVQVGAQRIDLVMLVMNQEGVQKLLGGKVTLGVDASIAAGPDGKQASAGTDAEFTAEILSYSRVQGLFAGVNMSGGVLRADDEVNLQAYGPNATPRTILASSGISAPTEATPLLGALNSVGNGEADRASKGNSSQNEAQSTPPEPATTVSPTADSDLRTRIVTIQQKIDRILSEASPSPVGTSGSAAAAPAPSTVQVNRARLLELRADLEALLTALNRR